MKSIIPLSFILAIAMNTFPLSAADTRCFEMRTYYAAPGKLEALHARFRDHTCKLFEKHAMVNLGYWVPLTNTENKLIYFLAYPSREARAASWKAFGNDPDWKAAQKASEANGPLVKKVESRLLSATDYSPAIAPSTNAESRVFELRIYTASAGNLPALHTRFREHTVALFSKHGMQQLGYWSLLPGQERADDTLIYLLAHKSQEAAEASFKAFRADPVWIAAKEASEKKAGGPLTQGGMAGVQSIFMSATDYSPTK
ncbi:MAG TPA: NIPSNAP family protein [Candidatus Saccharimonadales bacterium]|nr:NIPSNAP family protein [Candidatus Saccharimonadales bacterium]